MCSSWEGVRAAFVADGAVGDGAALGDGHGDGGVDAGLARGAGQHDGAEALGAAPDAAYLRAAARRHLGPRVLGGRRARGQLQRHPVRRDAAALPGAARRPEPGHQEHREQAEAPHRLGLHLFSFSLRRRTSRTLLFSSLPDSQIGRAHV